MTTQGTVTVPKGLVTRLKNAAEILDSVGFPASAGSVLEAANILAFPSPEAMTTQDIAGLVERAKTWDRCYPGNLNIEMLVDDLTSALEHLLREEGKISRLEERVQALEELIVRLASKESYL